MKVSLFAFLTTVTSLFACSDNHEKKSVSFKVLNDGLENSSYNLKRQNEMLYRNLEDKLQDGKTAQTAILWFPKAQYLQFRSREIYDYLDAVISDAKSDSILNNGDSLYMKLDFYKDKISRIDLEIYNNIKDSVQIITKHFDSVKQSKGQSLNLYFSDKSKDEQFFILTQTKYNIQLIENKTLRFCNNKIE